MPTLVHTAYAVPVGMCRMANAWPMTEATVARRNTTVGAGRVNPSLADSALAHTASRTALARSRGQAQRALTRPP